MWRMAEVTIASTEDHWLDPNWDHSNLHSVWYDDERRNFNIVLSTDYDQYYIAYGCYDGEINIWINTRNPEPSE